MKGWNQPSTLELIAAVQQVEDDWGVQEWEDDEEKWQHIVAELPHLPSYLDVDVQEISYICKTRFAEVCRYFNELFTMYRRDNCLTNQVMAALANYSSRLITHDRCFPMVGSRHHVRPIPCPYEYDEELDHACGSAVLEDTVSSLGESPAAVDEHGEKGIPNPYGYEEGPHHRGVSPAAKEPGNEQRRRHKPQLSCTGEEVSLQVNTVDDKLSVNVDFTKGRVRTMQDLVEPTVTSSNLEERNHQRDHPFFTIKLTQYYSTSRLLYMPAKICNRYMPKGKSVLLACILNGKKHWINYLPNKRSLSGGWSHFVRENGLKENDVLMFRRLDSTTFEVEINR